MKAVSVLEHFSDHDSIHQKLKKNTASVYSIAQLGSFEAQWLSGSVSRFHSTGSELRTPDWTRLIQPFIPSMDR
ncbi:hypothetical protein TNCV_2364121 [Trichonephila clavipes]|nr:hypothetical protein TNCV_2364121 [Trichonephila clavipes]